ncbi:MAG: hypothetical protein D6707_10685 [Bacteroidetes bacterium]|nr:MAG: hypothetical protein D6707_10685 [Bacteroidota bacterium]
MYNSFVNACCKARSFF